MSNYESFLIPIINADRVTFNDAMNRNGIYLFSYDVMSAEMVQQMTRKIYDSLYTTKCNFHIRTYTPLSVDASLAGIGHCTCSDWATLTFSS